MYRIGNVFRNSILNGNFEMALFFPATEPLVNTKALVLLRVSVLFLLNCCVVIWNVLYPDRHFSLALRMTGSFNARGDTRRAIFCVPTWVALFADIREKAPKPADQCLKCWACWQSSGCCRLVPSWAFGTP